MKLMNRSPLFIAEISANHLGSLTRAHTLIDEAAKAGASAVKFQTYTPDTMTHPKIKYAIESEHALWGSRNLYDLYKEAMTPWEWHRELFDHCHKVGVIPFSSPFDLSAVEFLESLDAPMYKIASLESSDLELIKAVAATGKPTIMSTGATEWHEIEKSVETFKNFSNAKLTLLVCTSSYPAEPKDANIARMENLRNHFKVSVGISDHTLGIGVSLAAVVLGAEAIEKHMTIKRTDGGADGSFSMEPHEFAQLVFESLSAQQAIGSAEWNLLPAENSSRELRRSLFVVEDVKRGDKLNLSNVKALRPALGEHPSVLSEMIGKVFSQDFEAGTPLRNDMVQNE